MANANMVLLDSLVALRSDGSLVVGRGVPDSWVQGGQVIVLANLPATRPRRPGTVTVGATVRAVTVQLTQLEPAS